MAETLEEKLAKIERGDSALLKMFQQTTSIGGDMYMSDLFQIGVAKRTLALSEGFRGLIKDRNFTSAAALLRMQLDTALRVFAATLVPSPERYANAVFDGEQVDRMKDRDGNRLTDRYLAKKLAEKYLWVEPVYTDLCNFVHFSNRHIFTSIAKVNDDERMVYFQVAAKDPPKPDEAYFEILDAFYEIMRVTSTLVGGWRMAQHWQKSGNAPPHEGEAEAVPAP